MTSVKFNISVLMKVFYFTAIHLWLGPPNNHIHLNYFFFKNCWAFITCSRREWDSQYATASFETVAGTLANWQLCRNLEIPLKHYHTEQKASQWPIIPRSWMELSGSSQKCLLKIPQSILYWQDKLKHFLWSLCIFILSVCIRSPLIHECMQAW